MTADGSIVAWGRNLAGQCDVPAPNADFVAVAAGREHSVGLKADGTLVLWGSNEFGQCTLPVHNVDFVAVAAGAFHTLALKATMPDCPGDLDGDGDVDLADLAAFLGSYGTCTGDEDYNPDADFDDSGCIDLSDLAYLLGYYGTGT